MDQLSFSGSRVVVTGAGRGIGREYALLLASRGASVIVVDSGCRTDGSSESGDPAAEVVEQIRAAGGNALAVNEDVSTQAGAESIIAQAVEAFGGVDALINNAGIVRAAPWVDVPAAEYQRHLDVHYFGTLWLCRAAWPHLQQSGTGAVLNTVSTAMLGNPMLVHYGASKGAVFGLTRNLAVEGAVDGIRVNAIAPGASTRMGEAAEAALTPEVLEYVRTQMSPALVAPAGAYLVHPSCTANGETFTVAAGIVSRMVMVNTVGIHDRQLTVETVAERWDEVMALTEAAQPQLVNLT